MTALSRRAFLLASCASALAGCAGAVVPVPRSAGTLDTQLLAKVARMLFPSGKVPDSHYAGLASALAGQVSDPARRAGWQTLLDTVALASDPLAGLQATTASPAFADIRTNVLIGHFSDPAVQRAIGFAGPSAEFGGYLDNGLDDIDWLAEPAS